MDDCPGILAIEQATLTAVPAPRLVFDGPFVVRRFLGGTGRANAACGLDPRPDPGLPARIDRIEAFYGLPLPLHAARPRGPRAAAGSAWLSPA